MNFKKVLKKLTPDFLLDFYYWLWALVGAVIFRFPSRNLIVIGVTGTSGKTTTVDFITRILEAGHPSTELRASKVASTSSIRFKVADKEWKNELKMTMPGRFKIQQFLRQAVKENCKYAVLEVTSEGIKQYRHKFINFDTAVFLNLTPEHIESHGGFENYRNAKLELFKATKNIHIINSDDKNAKYFLEVPAKKVITFSIGGKETNSGILQNNRIVAEDIGDAEFVVRGIKFSLNLLGNFNVLNALAAISTVTQYGISLETCKQALEKVWGIPGRMEVVSKNPLVVVDYAHTPEQLEQVYKSFTNSIELVNRKSKLICVLGSCGGGRDKWKRPVLGKIASQYCKEIIITNEDPYDEDPLEIMEQVAEGVGEKPYSIVLDRKEAIEKALESAKPNETVIITGKGAEPLMCLANGVKIPWDDRQIVRDFLSKK